MASYSVAVAKHVTLTANTVDTVTITGPSTYRESSAVEVTNWDSTARLFFRIDGIAPTVLGDDTYTVGPGQALTVSTLATVIEAVQLISASPVAYTVTAVNP